MPARGLKFIKEFLVPSLNSKQFGPRLEWIDVKHKIFQLQWNHKSASDWSSYDVEVFTEWDKMKGRYNPSKRDYFPKCKQRFRAILYKMIKGKHLAKINSEDKNIKLYCIGCGKNLPDEYSVDISESRENLNNFISENVDDPEMYLDYLDQPYMVMNPQDSITVDHSYSGEVQNPTDATVTPLSDIASNNVFFHWNGHDYNYMKCDENISKSTPFENTEDNHWNFFSDSPRTNIDLFVLEPNSYCDFPLTEESYSLPQLQDLTPLATDEDRRNLKKMPAKI